MIEKWLFPLTCFIPAFLACQQPQTPVSSASNQHNVYQQTILFDTTQTVIHVLVALCDNRYQGIVPVPAKIGNGQDPDQNLYWGCSLGVRTYFSKSRNWKLIRRDRPDSVRLERLVFRHQKTGAWLVAEAWDGRMIKQCTRTFFDYCSGNRPDTLQVQHHIIGIGGNARLIAYTGHDGLMDFRIQDVYQPANQRKREAIILACISSHFFRPHLEKTGARALLWTTGLMSPEAYTLHDALEAWLQGSSRDTVRIQAAKAYARYQHCSEKAALRLLINGQ